MKITGIKEKEKNIEGSGKRTKERKRVKEMKRIENLEKKRLKKSKRS